jgi:hypothetical protein
MRITITLDLSSDMVPADFDELRAGTMGGEFEGIGHLVKVSPYKTGAKIFDALRLVSGILVAVEEVKV